MRQSFAPACAVLLLFLASFAARAQSISVHAAHKEQFGARGTQTTVRTQPETIIPLQYDKSKRAGKSIFGYLPDWEYASSKDYLRYDILTHIAAFDFAVDVNGNMTLPLGWPWTDVINKAHQNGVKMILCVTNFNGDQIHTIITNTNVTNNFFGKLNSYIQQYSFDGVNIDFEDLNTADRGTPINSFMSKLTAYLKSYYPSIEVSFAGPALTSGWNVSGLASSCDYIFIMGYAFWGSWSTTTGACAPLTGGTLNIYNSVTQHWASVVSANPEKLILGVPYYGLKWTAVSNQPHATVRKWISSTRFRNDALNAPFYGIRWAADNQVPWYTYPADTGYYQVWYDNDTSLGLKYALAQSKNMKGVGMWALGYDGARNELWNELYRRYYMGTQVESEARGRDGAITITCHPNPANPSTMITVKGKEADFASSELEVFSVQGERVAILPLSIGADGRGSARWEGRNTQGNQLPNGMYLARLRTAERTATIKILLLK